MAATAISMQLRSKHRPIRNPTFVHFLSTSSNSDPTSSPESPPEPPQSQSQSPFALYFSDVKASLKQQPPPPNRLHQQQHRKPFSFSSSTSEPAPSKVTSLEEIRKNLSEFRRRSCPPSADDKSSSPPPHSSQPISFQDLYKRNVIDKSQGSGTEATKGGILSFEAIRESLRQLRQNSPNSQGQVLGRKTNDPMSISTIKDSFKIRPGDPNSGGPAMVMGEGTDRLPSPVFDKEMRDMKEDSAAVKTEFLKTYTFQELGEKLRKLRPTGRKEEHWFSLQELNERLKKLRELEEKESESRIGGVTFKDLRDSLVRLKMSDDEKAKKTSIQRIDILGQLGGTPSFMLAPPKEHQVEKYFHPDNMSSAEKLKLELKKVREEFKMSESDCGSARVQVAQLTTKIKHLSSVLHKKDKHSRKGVQEMVQKRKKSLKYLRRTDWDSYCLVLSKLGLRDNPDYKN